MTTDEARYAYLRNEMTAVQLFELLEREAEPRPVYEPPAEPDDQDDVPAWAPLRVAKLEETT